MRKAQLRWRLGITRHERDGAAVFVAEGRLGTLTAGNLIEALASAIAAGDRRILLDLSGVDYLSSAGLLALDAILGRLHVVDGALVLCGLTEPVRVAFELSGLLPHFREAPSVSEGLAALSVPAASAGG
jgi:anti-anti-sigma factor